MALSLKRASISMDSTSPYSGASSICSKRQCLRSSPILSNCQNLLRDRNGHSSSSSSSSEDEDEENDDDDDSEIVSVQATKNNKLRKQRRNQRSIKRSLGVSTPLDSKLTKAVSQYSDDEDDDNNCQDNSLQNRKRYFMKARKSINMNFDDDRVSHFIPTDENHSSYSSSYSTKENNSITHKNEVIAQVQITNHSQFLILVCCLLHMVILVLVVIRLEVIFFQILISQLEIVVSIT
ncbi:unnamed protein product [[Candida] boidinii]|nr:unnamed protein product [[Candida] boidinii]